MAVVFRGFWIFSIFLLALCAYGYRRVRRGRMTPDEVERLRGEVLADTLQRLGATFVKMGQILGSRPDLIGPGYITALARLQDQVAPAPFRLIDQVIDQDLGPLRSRFASIEDKPLAAASVAQVHRARLVDGRDVALKVQRPSARPQIERDLALMAFFARLFDVIPAVHLLSLPGSVEEFGRSLRGQLDFRREADNNRRFAENFKDWQDVRFPGLIDELCTERVLSMELVVGVKASEPEKVQGDRRRLAKLGGETVLKMVFHDGFVHADLHPGNVMLTADGRVVIIDLGMVATVPSEMVRPWIESNLALAQQQGRRAAQLFYMYAPSVTTANYHVYEDEVDAFFQTFYGKMLGEVEVSEVLGGIMAILRRHGIKIDPSFTVVNVSMLVAEGLGKQLDPGMDMLELCKPWLLEALTKAPPGKQPYRLPPELPAATSAAAQASA